MLHLLISFSRNPQIDEFMHIYIYELNQRILFKTRHQKPYLSSNISLMSLSDEDFPPLRAVNSSGGQVLANSAKPKEPNAGLISSFNNSDPILSTKPTSKGPVDHLSSPSPLNSDASDPSSSDMLSPPLPLSVAPSVSDCLTAGKASGPVPTHIRFTSTISQMDPTVSSLPLFTPTSGKPPSFTSNNPIKATPEPPLTTGVNSHIRFESPIADSFSAVTPASSSITVTPPNSIKASPSSPSFVSLLLHQEQKGCSPSGTNPSVRPLHSKHTYFSTPTSPSSDSSPPVSFSHFYEEVLSTLPKTSSNDMIGNNGST